MKSIVHALIRRPKGTRFSFTSANRRVNEFRDQVYTYLGIRTEERKSEIFRGGRTETMTESYPVIIIQGEHGNIIELDYTWEGVSIDIMEDNEK